MPEKYYPEPDETSSHSSVNEPQASYGLNANAENEWWNLISQEERQAIEKGLTDIEAGRTISHNEMNSYYHNILWMN